MGVRIRCPDNCCHILHVVGCVWELGVNVTKGGFPLCGFPKGKNLIHETIFLLFQTLIGHKIVWKLKIFRYYKILHASNFKLGLTMHCFSRRINRTNCTKNRWIETAPRVNPHGGTPRMSDQPWRHRRAHIRKQGEYIYKRIVTVLTGT